MCSLFSWQHAISYLFSKLGNSCISIFSNEPEAYNTVKTGYSEEKLSVLSIFEGRFWIGRHLEFFQGHFLKKISKKV
jgi:hypothetical protein